MIPRIGVQLEGRAAWQIKYLGPQSFVVYRIRWNECELSPGQIIFPNSVIEDLNLLRPWPVLINIKGTPEWARYYPEIECSAPRQPIYFARFAEAVARTFWPALGVSIYNEPEVSAQDAQQYGVAHHLGGFGLQHWRRYAACVIYTNRYLRPLGVPVIAGELIGDGGLFWRQVRAVCRGAYSSVAFHIYARWTTQQWVVWQTSQKYHTLGDHRLICTETNYIQRTSGEPDPVFLAEQAWYLESVLNNVDLLGVERLAIYAGRSGWMGADLWSHPLSYQAYSKVTQ